MKKPEEIKKGLECCQHNEYNGLCDCDNGCPYRFKRCDQLRKDGLAYIQQLESENCPSRQCVDDSFDGPWR